MAQCKYCLKEFTPPLRQPKSKRCSSKQCLQAYKNEWARNNPHSKNAWVIKNPEKRKEASEKYRKQNKEYYRQYASLRSRYIKQAKPKWVDEEKLLEFYKLAVELGLEVDHIIPLKHDKVCGLHVPWNLQLLTRSENARKSNKFDEDVVAVLKEAA